MKLEIEMSNDEVCAILSAHIRKNVLPVFSDDKDISISSRHYSGLAALVKVYDKLAQEDGE